LWAEQVGITADQAKLIENRGAELEAAKKDAQRTLEAFGFNDQMVADQSKFSQKVIRFWYDVDTAWSTLLGTAEKPITTQLEKLDKWIEGHPDEVKALMILGGGVTAAGGAKAVGGFVGRNVFGFGTPAKALTGSATALTGSAKALDAAAEKLAAGGKGGGSGGNAIELGKAGILSTLTDFGGLIAGGVAAIGVMLALMGRNPDDAGKLYFGGMGTPTVPPPGIDAETAGDFAGNLIGGSGIPNAGRGTRAQREGTERSLGAPDWSLGKLFKPWTWGADKPSRDATPDALETGNGGGFRIPGSDKSVDFGDQAVSIKSGGTTVQSGNPLPVRIEKIDPAAGGIGGFGGSGGGGEAPGTAPAEAHPDRVLMVERLPRLGARAPAGASWIRWPESRAAIETFIARLIPMSPGQTAAAKAFFRSTRQRGGSLRGGRA
jgi:hypothetical protein